MGAPAVAISRFDLNMGYQEFSLRADRLQFGGLKILTPLMVGSVSLANFPRINLESLLTAVEDTQRAPNGEYVRDTYDWHTDSYQLEDHGVEETLDDGLTEMYGDAIRQESMARMRAVDRVLRPLERTIAQLLFNATTFSGQTTAAGTVWTNRSGADPVANIETAMNAVEDRTGIVPNTLVLPRRRFQDAQHNANILGRIDSGTNDAPGKASRAGLMSLFDGLEQIIVVGGNINTANPAQSASLSKMWDQSMGLVCNVSDSALDENDMESMVPHLGRTLFHDVGLSDSYDENMLIMEEYREPRRRGGIIRARNWYGTKLLHVEAGQLLTGLA